MNGHFDQWRQYAKQAGVTSAAVSDFAAKVIDELSAIDADMPTIWLMGLAEDLRTLDEDATPIIATPAAMRALADQVTGKLQVEREAVATEYGLPTVRAGGIDGELVAVVMAGIRRTLTGREYMARLQAVQARLGLPVFDGYAPTPRGWPIHPGVIDGYADLLSEQWQAHWREREAKAAEFEASL